MPNKSKAILKAHSDFYTSFVSGDYSSMESVWARENPVLVIHPWGPAIAGRVNVMKSWEQILLNPPKIRCTDEKVALIGEFAIVTCIERASEGALAATNILVEENGSWVFCHHHAGPLAPVFSSPPSSLH